MEPHGSAWRWIALAVVVVLGLWFGIRALQNAEPAGAEEGGGAMPSGFPPATVFVAPVALQSVQQRREVTGSLRAVERAEVSTQESGKVEEVLVDVGDRIEKGASLLQMDDRRMKAELNESKSMATAAAARVSERKAEADRAERDLKMKEGLFSQRAVSEREFLDSKREASVAEARFKAAVDEQKAAESALELLEVRLDDLSVEAPFSGVVVERHVDAGEWLAPGDGVVTLISSGMIEAWINVPERFAGRINSEDADLEILVEGSGLRVPALSIRQVADIDATTRLFPIVVEIDDLDGKLVPGLSVRAEIPVGDRSERLALPVDAVLETISGASVFKSVPGESLPVAMKVPVEILFREGTTVYVRSGQLKPGESVVVEGNERLFPGTPLLVGKPPREDAEPVEEVKP
ncbi:MAG: efflux RND transporter periplasmic adaptor subunit [Verrucomicrobiota bacterium]